MSLDEPPIHDLESTTAATEPPVESYEDSPVESLAIKLQTLINCLGDSYKKSPAMDSEILEPTAVQLVSEIEPCPLDLLILEVRTESPIPPELIHPVLPAHYASSIN